MTTTRPARALNPGDVGARVRVELPGEIVVQDLLAGFASGAPALQLGRRLHAWNMPPHTVGAVADRERPHGAAPVLLVFDRVGLDDSEWSDPEAPRFMSKAVLVSSDHQIEFL